MDEFQQRNDSAGVMSPFSETVSSGPSARAGFGDLTDEDSDPCLRVRGTSVLIVDDSPEGRVALARSIQRWGGEVDFAENGLEGLKMALSHHYDIVLMDIRMPKIDGLDAIRKLRGYGYEGSVVAVTGHSREAEREDCLQAGFDDYLTKPVQRLKLLSAVASQPRRFRVPRVH